MEKIGFIMKASKTKQLLLTINTKLLDERAKYVRTERTPEAEKLRKAQMGIFKTIKEIGETGDIAIILTTEKTILTNELRLYGNSPGMKSSLESALLDLGQAEKHLDLVQDPKRYKELNELIQRPKNRVGGVPKDEARQFFEAQNKRLLNQDRSRLTDTEKKTLDARRDNLYKAKNQYIVHQHKALGIEPKGKAVDRGLSR